MTTRLNSNSVELGTRTTTERNAMTGVQNGTLIYNTTTAKVEVYDTGVPGWFPIGP